MWRIENHTPFAAERAFARDRSGAEIWIAAVKASYLVGPDGSVGIGEQTPPAVSSEYLGEPGKSTLRYDSDLQLTKPGTDVILHGHAYSSEPVSHMHVFLRAGPLEKDLLVTGDRFWDWGMFGLSLSSPVPFTKIPLTYENTYGGTDDSETAPGVLHFLPENPVGTGFCLKKEDLAGKKAPNVEYADNGKRKPACFAPLPGDWMPRAKHGGTYDENWREKRAPLLPEDFDDRFFYCAPRDQQVPGGLKGGETVEIYGMSPGGPLKFKLPSPEFTFKTVLGQKTEEHGAKLHTVILEPDIPGFSMVWHTALDVHGREQMLEKTIIT